MAGVGAGCFARRMDEELIAFPVIAGYIEEITQPQLGGWMKLSRKIIWLTVGAAVLPILVLTGLIRLARPEVESEMERELDKLSSRQLRRTVADVYQMCELTHSMTADYLDLALKTAHAVLEREKGAAGVVVDNSDRREWTIVNQESPDGMSERVSLGRMLIGGREVGGNDDFGVSSPIVDEVLKTTGALTTIFQMLPDGGMLRICTNVPGGDGKRAVGTYIPVSGVNGEENAIIAAVMSGGVYRGIANVAGEACQTIYEPLRDIKGKVVGMYFVGVPLRGLRALKDAMRRSSGTDSGSLFVLGGAGVECGRFILGGDKNEDGGSMWNKRGPDGEYVARTIVRRALELKGGKTEMIDYNWYGRDGAPSERIAAFAYFTPWDWVIVSSVDEDDFNEVPRRLDSSLRLLFMAILAIGVTVLVVVVLLSIWLGRRIAKPINMLAGVANLLSSGDIAAARDELSRIIAGRGGRHAMGASPEETAALTLAVDDMVENLSDLNTRIKDSGLAIMSSANQIAAAANLQSGRLRDLGVSTNEIMASVKEITATSHDLVARMSGVAERTAEAAGLADSGSAGLERMESSIRGLSGATGLICAKLGVINEKTANINGIVTAIDKIAEQINMLSLNAAIEAEKAGEQGMGFAVVAREIRRLADQTALAATDIAGMVEEMRSAVSSGVMEMDKFSEIMRIGIEGVGDIHDGMSELLARVDSLPPEYGLVREGMESQTIGAEHISAAMTALNDGIKETVQSLEEFKMSTDRMQASVKSLGASIERFKT